VFESGNCGRAVAELKRLPATRKNSKGVGRIHADVNPRQRENMAPGFLNNLRPACWSKYLSLSTLNLKQGCLHERNHSKKAEIQV